MATRAGLHQTPSPARSLAFFGRDPDDKRRQPSRHRFHFLAPERVPSDLIGRPKRLIRASACHRKWQTRFGCLVAQMITAAERRPPAATPALVYQQHPLKIYSPDSAAHSLAAWLCRLSERRGTGPGLEMNCRARAVTVPLLSRADASAGSRRHRMPLEINACRRNCVTHTHCKPRLISCPHLIQLTHTHPHSLPPWCLLYAPSLPQGLLSSGQPWLSSPVPHQRPAA